jgi:poly(beta-D-mannuronate) lyase
MTLQIRVGPKDTARNIRIDHNHFRDIRRRHQNGGEAVQIGSNPMKYGRMRADAVVEYNRFERADGDGEVISNKSSGNIIRNNTFLGCGGGLWLRGGEQVIVADNLFLGGAAGIVAYGHGHRITGNVIRNTHSYALLAEFGSDWETVHDAGLSFEALHGSLLEGNAVVDPKVRGLVYGAFRLDEEKRRMRPNPPRGNRVLNNMLIGDTDRLLMAEEYGETAFEGNRIAPGKKQGGIPEGFVMQEREEALKHLPERKEMTADEMGAAWLRP